MNRFLANLGKAEVRPGEEIPLAKADSEVSKRHQVVEIFDSLCNGHRIDGGGNAYEGADHLALDRALGDAAAKNLAELNEVRLQVHDDFKIGVPGANIVDGNAKAHVGVAGERLSKGCKVLDGKALGDLKDEVCRREPSFFELRNYLRLDEVRIVKRSWKKIEKEAVDGLAAFRIAQGGSKARSIEL